MNAAIYRDILDVNLLQSTLDLGTKVNLPTTLSTQKITEEEWFQDNSVNVLEWPSQRPDLNPTEHFCKDLKMAVH